MGNVHAPTVVFREIRQAVDRWWSYVHKVNIAHAVVENTIHVHGEEEQNPNEFQGIEIIFDTEFKFFARGYIQRKHNKGNVVQIVLDCNHPIIQRGACGNENRRQTAD